MSRSLVLPSSSRRLTATGAVTALAALALVASPSAEDDAPASVGRAAVLPYEAPAPPPPPVPEAPEEVVMATVAGVELVVPAVDPAVVGFHQGGSTALPLEPAEAEHVVMASRGRSTASTSAVDVAVGEDPTVTAPVAGVVTAVAEYALYGRHDDVLVTIEPHDADVVVQLMHLEDVTVEVGDRVRPGQEIARARHLPVRSQVDRHHDGPAGAHVHLDVTPR